MTGKTSDAEALALYVMLDRDVGDFIDGVVKAHDGTLEALHAILAQPNESHDGETRRLNEMGAVMVARHIRQRKERAAQSR